MKWLEGENFLWKSRIKRVGQKGFGKTLSPEVIKRIPSDIGTVVASISYQRGYNSCSGSCSSDIKFYVGVDAKGYDSRIYTYVTHFAGSEFQGNSHKVVVEEAKNMLKKPDFLSFILGQYVGNKFRESEE
jgi:hypothetical protein